MVKKVARYEIERAIEVLRQGGVVVFPTETAYGLGCDATNVEAVERIVKMKERPSTMGMAVIVDSIEMAKSYGDFGETEEGLSGKYWPGPLTIVMHNTKGIAPLCHKADTIGVRVSSNAVAHALAEGLGKPIVATSANVHGAPASYSCDAARGQLAEVENGPDLYLDGGVLPKKQPSMVIEVIDGEIIVHRNGSYKL